MTERQRILVALVALACARCSSSSPSVDAGVDAADGAHAGGQLTGAVTVDLITDDHTAFLGVFFDGPRPDTQPMDVAQTQGDCTLVVPRAIACTPACAAGSVCAGTGQCEVSPAQISVGVLHVHGLGGADLDLAPSAPSAPSYQAVPTLPYPSCAEGGAVTASTDAFALAATCVGPLVVTSTVPISVTSGQPMHLAWTLPAHAGTSRVQIELEISHHGGYKGEIECDVADTGAFDVPASLVSALVALGRAGYPTVKITRASTATAPTQPGVSLSVTSRVELDVDTGVISCGADASPPCADGTTCQPDYTCR